MYQETNNPTATYGEKSPSVLALQQSLNQQNAGKAGWTPLAEDSMYGPLTQAGVNWQPQNQLIVTGSNLANQFAQNSQQLNQVLGTKAGMSTFGQEQAEMFKQMETYSDPYTQMLDRISQTSDLATKNLISTIQAKRANQAQMINQEYDRLKSGLMSLGVSTGNINFTPDLVYGNIMQAENARLSKLQDIDRDEATALLEAKQAQEDKDFKVLKEKMDYYKSLQKSRLDILKENFETMSYEAKIGELQANQIYDELQKLPESQKLPFLQEIANRFGIPLTALTSQVGQITRDRTPKPTGTGGGTKTPGFTITQTNRNTLGGAGFSNQDIDDLLRLVNESTPNEVYQLLKNNNYSQSQLDAFAKVFGIGSGTVTPKKFFNVTPTNKNKLINLGLQQQAVEGIIEMIEQLGIVEWEKAMKDTTMDKKLRKSIVKIFK